MSGTHRADPATEKRTDWGRSGGVPRGRMMARTQGRGRGRVDLVGVRGAICEDPAVQQHVVGLVHVEVDVVAGWEALVVVLERAIEEGARECLLVAGGPQAVEDPPPHVGGGPWLSASVSAIRPRRRRRRGAIGGGSGGAAPRAGRARRPCGGGCRLRPPGQAEEERRSSSGRR